MKCLQIYHRNHLPETGFKLTNSRCRPNTRQIALGRWAQSFISRNNKARKKMSCLQLHELSYYLVLVPQLFWHRNPNILGWIVPPSTECMIRNNFSKVFLPIYRISLLHVTINYFFQALRTIVQHLYIFILHSKQLWLTMILKVAWTGPQIVALCSPW